MTKFKYLIAGFFVLIHLLVVGQTSSVKSEIQYLSGTGKDTTVDWQFYCSEGMNSGVWTTIGVPSCWEQQSFGGYNYGQDDLATRHKEFGLYKHQFLATEEWELTSESFYLTMTNVEKNDLAMVFKFELE